MSSSKTAGTSCGWKSPTGSSPLCPSGFLPTDPPGDTVAADNGRTSMNTALMADAINGFGQRLNVVDSAQWKAVTPCEAWDVRTLVNHVVGELLWVPPLLEGKTIA